MSCTCMNDKKFFGIWQKKIFTCKIKESICLEPLLCPKRKTRKYVSYKMKEVNLAKKM